MASPSRDGQDLRPGISRAERSFGSSLIPPARPATPCAVSRLQAGRRRRYIPSRASPQKARRRAAVQGRQYPGALPELALNCLETWREQRRNQSHEAPAPHLKSPWFRNLSVESEMEAKLEDLVVALCIGKLKLLNAP